MKVMLPKEEAEQVALQTNLITKAVERAYQPSNVHTITEGEREIITCLAMLHEALIMVLGRLPA